MLYLITHAEKRDDQPDPPHTLKGSRDLHALRNFLYLIDLSLQSEIDVKLLLSGTAVRTREIESRIRELFPHLPPTIYDDMLGTQSSIYNDEAGSKKVILEGGLIIPPAQYRELRDNFTLRAMWGALRKIDKLARGDKVLCCVAHLLRAIGWKDKTSASIFKVDPWKKEVVWRKTSESIKNNGGMEGVFSL